MSSSKRPRGPAVDELEYPVELSEAIRAVRQKPRVQPIRIVPGHVLLAMDPTKFHPVLLPSGALEVPSGSMTMAEDAFDEIVTGAEDYSVDPFVTYKTISFDEEERIEWGRVWQHLRIEVFYVLWRMAGNPEANAWTGNDFVVAQSAIFPPEWETLEQDIKAVAQKEALNRSLRRQERDA